VNTWRRITAPFTAKDRSFQSLEISGLFFQGLEEKPPASVPLAGQKQLPCSCPKLLTYIRQLPILPQMRGRDVLV
jgi:hypothetical protein